MDVLFKIFKIKLPHGYYLKLTLKILQRLLLAFMDGLLRKDHRNKADRAVQFLLLPHLKVKQP